MPEIGDHYSPLAASEVRESEKKRICERNRQLMMVTTFMYALIQSMENSGIFDAYIYIVGGRRGRLLKKAEKVSHTLRITTFSNTLELGTAVRYVTFR